ncbi:uncharacterized protein LOC115267484 [Aedes albopictus]|uniref:Secreted protein n=1 Tax=Aedes albopictus TaxID=7160 RepID=A0ABM1YFX7_AEDAL|nr:uncharacterized protein LOC109397962 [Aedes albopictus]
MKSFLLVLAVVAGCYGQGFQGYFYPRPSIPFREAPCQTVYRTQTLTRTAQYPVYYTSTVQYPVYLTSTVVDQQYLTVYSTLIQPVIQYQTRTSTLVIRPTPVTQYSTIVSTVTIVSSVQDDSRQPTVNNAYLPPAPEVSDEAREPDNEYLPPTAVGNARGSSSGANILSSDYESSSGSSGSSVRVSPFGQQAVSLNLGALPPVA